MKGAMKSVSDKLQLRKRAIIENINDEKDLLCKKSPAIIIQSEYDCR